MRHETFATFRLRGDALVAEEVTRQLDIPPHRAFNKGEPNPARSQRPMSAGVWELTSEGRVESVHLEEHLLYLVARLEPQTKALHELVRRQSLTADFWCYVETDSNV